MDDNYENLINENWEVIIKAYNDHKDKKPIIEFDIKSQKINSCPAIDYINHLSKRTIEETKKQYKDACNNNEFLLFVKDEKNKKLYSCIFPIE